MPISIRIVQSGAYQALRFPQFEGGSRLGELARGIAHALGTEPRRPAGSLLETLIGFVGYPDAFALWWDGFTCELGCSSPCGIDLDKVAARLMASGAFEVGPDAQL